MSTPTAPQNARSVARSRGTRQILGAVKLQRVDEDADDARRTRDVRLDQPRVAGVQRAHGRHEADRCRPRRRRRPAARIAAMVSTTRGVIASAGAARRRARRGKRPARTSSTYAAVAVDDLLGELRVLLDERRHEAVEQPEHVVADQHLAVAIGPGADADRRDRRARAVIARARASAGIALQHHRERAGLLERARVVDSASASLGSVA